MHIPLRPASTIPVPNDLSANLRPKLVTGLKGVGAMTAEYCKGKSETQRCHEETRTLPALKRVIV